MAFVQFSVFIVDFIISSRYLLSSVQYCIAYKIHHLIEKHENVRNQVFFFINNKLLLDFPFEFYSCETCG